MDIHRSGSRPSARGPAAWFTGTVRIDPLFAAAAPARAAGNAVTFEPDARTAWHTHPLGQTLIVTSGLGRAQREGGPVAKIRPGDVVWFAPYESTGAARRGPGDGDVAYRGAGGAGRRGGEVAGAGDADDRSG